MCNQMPEVLKKNKKTEPGIFTYICNASIQRLKQEDCKFKASLYYIVKTISKKKKKQTKNACDNLKKT